MAHAVVEWTANLEGELDLGAVLRLIAGEMRDGSGGVFPVGGIRVRGLKVTDYVIADGGEPRDAFINIVVTMGAGRPAEFRKAFFDGLFEKLKAELGELFEARPLALSLYVNEAEGWKHNTVHSRLQKAANAQS